MKILQCLFLGLGFMLTASANDFRTWTTSTGSNTVGRFVSCSKTDLLVECTNGVKLQIDFASLSTNDLDFVCTFINEGRLKPIEKDTFRIWCSTAGAVLLAKFREIRKEYVFLESVSGNILQIKHASLTPVDQLILKDYLGYSTVQDPATAPMPNENQATATKKLSDREGAFYREWLMRNRPRDAMRIRQAQANAKGQQVMILQNTFPSTSNANQIEDMYKRGWIKEGDVVVGGNIIHSYGEEIESDSKGYFIKDKNGNITERYDKKGNPMPSSGMSGEGMGWRVPTVETVE